MVSRCGYKRPAVNKAIELLHDAVKEVIPQFEKTLKDTNSSVRLAVLTTVEQLCEHGRLLYRRMKGA